MTKKKIADIIVRTSLITKLRNFGAFCVSGGVSSFLQLVIFTISNQNIFLTQFMKGELHDKIIFKQASG